MLEDLQNNKYNTRFYFVSELINETDGRVLDNIFNILKNLEDTAENIDLKIQVKYFNNPDYVTILTVKDIKYVARISRYDPFNITDDDFQMYNQVTFLCNLE